MINVVNKKTHEETPYDYYIGRPSPIGNPYSHLPHSIHAKYIVDTRDEAINNYEEWLKYKIMEKDPVILKELKKIIDFYKTKGEINLLCWCDPKRCHGDVIKKFLEGKLFDE